MKFDSNAHEVIKIQESRRGGMTACPAESGVFRTSARKIADFMDRH